MKIKYDQEVDILVIKLSEAAIVESDEEKKGIIIDYDEAGNIVRLEILDASKKGATPTKLEFELAQ